MARKRFSENGKKQNIIKYANWNVSGIFHREEKLDSILIERQITIAAITESKKEIEGYNGNK